MKEKRTKFTTTLTPTHIAKLTELTGILGERNLNDTIEMLVDKKMEEIKNELANKQRHNRR